MTITIVGHGYVGLVAACTFADFGNTVHVVGHTPAKLERLKSGDPIIYEPGLAELLQKNLKSGRLHFTDRFEEAVPHSEIIFITVGTPPKNETGEADLTTVFAVAKKIGQNLDPDKFTVVSCKSTVPVGTNLEVKRIIESELSARTDAVKPIFSVASCPEFLREGTGIYDTLNPDRVVIGSDDQKAIDLLVELHKPFPGKRVLTNLASAELIKYASNSLLATKISFANLIALFAEQCGADAASVLEAVGLDNRIGPRFLNAGIGYGGSCFPKDVQALAATGETLGLDISLLDAVEKVNELAWRNFVTKVETHVPAKSHIAVWGLAFKQDTDDIRFSPTVKIIRELVAKGYTVSAYDPAAMANVKKQLGDSITYVDEPYQALEHADALCVLTQWNEFRQADLAKVKQLLKKPLIIDGRNLYDPIKMKEQGFTYISTGR
ncbi:UDP-glucose/GDP-mannose dehydrogenase family protein [Candidatus Woesebacteria bacterium]|nr:UDP-glucose/GDP-mannose dehydrogenase family protein [Candidatus Woesebacteria bacterium]